MPEAQMPRPPAESAVEPRTAVAEGSGHLADRHEAESDVAESAARTKPTYRYSPHDIRAMLAARSRYAADHPDFDPDRHTLISVQRSDTWHDPEAFEITGHEAKDPQIEAMFNRCCCHPDKPRGHRD